VDSGAIDTSEDNRTEQRLVRLERLVWALVMLLSCALAAMIISYVWVSVWSQNALGVAKALHVGGS
jgi:hypothetical protein